MDNANSALNDQPVAGWYGVDPTRTDLKANPHSLYKHLREVQPVNLTPAGDWRL